MHAKLKKGLVSALCFAWASSAFSAVELKLGHFGSEEHPSHIAAMQFAKNVEARTNGDVKVELYPNNALGSPPEVLEQVIFGVIDMSLSGQDQLAKHVPLFDTVSIPFSLENAAHADRVLDGPFKAWAAPELEKIGLVYLSSWDWGFRQLTNSVKPILSPDDVKGLKIRTPPAMTYQAAMQAIGANVQTISFSELVMAMRQGVVDGQENPIGVIYNLKLYESQKYISIINYLYSSMVHVVSADAWNRLTPAQQVIVQEESDAARLLMRELLRAEEQKQIADMRANGIQIDEPDLAPFQAMMGPAYDQIKKKVGAANFDKWMEMTQSVK
ncbi:TRAP transporter substrate-binding protein [Reinekea marinisedimentorum]|uniref:Tripartite ATP-independent transporter DctP family solute receptor n=1 Tax=Reinekea marinisedimentorum TaxID=230495 RepID=A0A4R3I722_9GAMM|nr:TRAP transporter substrate-binding protein [Reinekea marinisedimentorum]TCS41029.1 tripartite ATP-independent transporter DctP family solute receptor [Reinekea marinisedimentorum]